MLAPPFARVARIATLVAAFAWLGPGALSAQDKSVATGVVAGVVHDSAGTGLADVAITVVDPRTGTETPGKTVFNGRFAIPGLQLGVAYQVKLAKVAYYPATIDSLVIPASKVIRIDYTLTPNRTRELEKVTVSDAPKGSKLARKFLGADEIAKAKVSTALDAVQRLRPIMLAPNHDVCITRDSLSLYVDGIRRPVYNSQAGTASGTNEQIVRDALAAIPSDDVAEVTFVSCDEYNAKIQHRNVIWLLTKRYKAKSTGAR